MSTSSKNSYLSIDLFSGVGGLTSGMHRAGFKTEMAFELDDLASKAYNLNHKKTKVITKDIRKVDIEEVKQQLNGQTIHLLAGCPPCQGFSSIRRLNKSKPVKDDRNGLINEYVRFIKELMPYTFMMENVPGLALDNSFHKARKVLEKLGYYVDHQVVNVKDYGVPQSRKRLVMVGSRLGPLKVAKPINKKVTVRDTIGGMPVPEETNDPLHKIFPIHTPEIYQLIKDIPHNGGSRKDLGKDRQLKCHQKENVGFNDVYGRLRWDDYSTTITGGCLNPSKGRFLHPEQDRCISAREAALLQSFPKNYKFPVDAPKSSIALMIGNALPPRFSYYQSKNIKQHILVHLG
jgi:DNA (cytosine-5)-methyltransferase 1